ncbi:MAG: YIP1 family protein [Muribaculaceae bacterium]|nr:YIP1 family protein [Muribaculaceae bacterium]
MVEDTYSKRRSRQEDKSENFRGVRQDKSPRINSTRSADNEEDRFLKSLCYDDKDTPDAPHDDYTEGQKPNLWWAFLHLLINPKLGWRKLKKAPCKSDEFARVVFYPLLALLAVCRFADMLYYDNVSIAPLLQKAVASFVAFFGGYYLIGLLARTFLPTKARTKIEDRFGQIYIMAILSSLAVCGILSEVLPWLDMLLIVPPIYCCYILAKGIKCLRIPERENVPVLILMIVLCLGIPIGIYATLTSLMPIAA